MKKVLKEKVTTLVLAFLIVGTLVPSIIFATNNDSETAEEAVETEAEIETAEDETEDTASDAESETDEDITAVTVDSETGEISVEDLTDTLEETEEETGAEEDVETTASEDEAGTKEETEAAEEEYTRTVYLYVGEEIKIIATLDNAEDLPDEAVLTAERLTDTQNYLDILNDEDLTFVYSDDNTLIYDISFALDGEEIEPAGSVNVDIKFRGDQLSEIDADSAENLTVIHFSENNGSEEFTVEWLDEEGTEDSISFTTDGFSPVAVTNYLTHSATSIDTIDWSGTVLSSKSTSYVSYQTIDDYPAFCMSFGLSTAETSDLYYYPDYDLSVYAKQALAYFMNQYYKGFASTAARDMYYAYAQTYIWVRLKGYGASEYSDVLNAVLTSLFNTKQTGSKENIYNYIASTDYSDYDFYVYRAYDSSAQQYFVTISPPNYRDSYLYLEKSGDSDYSLTGALYGVYESKSDAKNETSAVCYFITNSKGVGYIANTTNTSSTVTTGSNTYKGSVWYSSGKKYLTIEGEDLVDGSITYYIKELLAPKSGKYSLSDDIGSITIKKAGAEYTYECEDELGTAELYLQKSGDNGSEEEYSLTGALYGVYESESDAEKETSAVCYFITNSKGVGYIANTTNTSATVTTGSNTYKGSVWYSSGTKYYTVDLSDGSVTYYFKELLAPKSGKYALSDDIGSITIKNAGAEYTYECADELKSAYLKLIKETDTDVDTIYSMKGALYGVYSSNSDAKNETNAVGYFIVGTGTTGTSTGYVATTDEDEASTTSYSATYNGDTYYRSSTTKMYVDLDGADSVTYYVKEVVAPSNGRYILDDTITSVTITTAATVTVTVEEEQYAYLKLTKTSWYEDYGKSLKGALYGVYESSSDANNERNAIAYFITGTGTATATGYIAKAIEADSEEDAISRAEDDDDIAATSYYAYYNGYYYFRTSDKTLYVEPGQKYYAKELVAPFTNGYIANDEVIETTKLDCGDTFVFESEDEGYIEVSLSKTSSVSAAYVTDNAAYSLEGAVYRVYTNEACTTRATDIDGNKISFATDNDGTSDVVSLAYGSVYYIKEYSVSPGYMLDTTVYVLDLTDESSISAGASYTIECTEVPDFEPLWVTIQKTNEDGDDCGGIAGAVIKAVYSYTNTSGDTSTLTNYYITDDNGEINLNSTDFVCASNGNKSASYNNFPTDDDGEIVIYYGTVTITEGTAPTGYVVSDETFIIDFTFTGSKTSGYTLVSSVGADITMTVTENSDGSYSATLVDPTIRGGVELTKVDKDAYATDQDADKTQGDATLEGAQIAIITNGSSANANKNGAVYMTENDVEESDYIKFVEDENDDGWYEVGETMLILTTYEYEGEIIATTDGNHDGECYTLPYGTYIAQEVTDGASEGYLNNTTWSTTFIIFSIVHCCSYTGYYHLWLTTYKKSLLFLLTSLAG